MTLPIVKRFFVSLKNNNLLGILTFILVVGGAGIIALREPPPTRYKSVGVLAFSPSPPTFTQTAEQIQQQGRQINEETLLADRVLVQVKEKTEIPPKEIISKLKIILPREGSSQAITLEYVDSKEKRSQAMVGVLMQTMIEHSRWLNTFRLQEQIDKISERLPEASQELKEAEEALDQYIRKEGAALLAVQDGTLIQRITGSQQQQESVLLRLEELNTQISSLENRLGLSAEQAYTSSALSADPIIADVRAQIFQLETQFENLSKDYKVEHPNMVELRGQIDARETLLRERAAEVLRSDAELTSLEQIRVDSTLNPATQQLANNLVALQLEEETLRRRLATLIGTEQELRQEYAAFPNKQFQQNRLAEQVALKQDLFTRMQSALADAQAAEAETTSSLSVATPPVVSPIVTPTPNPIVVMGAGTGLGLIAGMGVIFLLSTLDNKLYTPQEIKSLAQERDVPILGELPIFTDETTLNGKMPVLQGDNLAYLPVYDRFRSNIRRLNRKTKVILVTSMERYEGKSVTAYNLAIASAHSGKRTLLLEGDLRSPSLAEALDVAVDTNAAVEPLRYYNSHNNCVRLVPNIENLYIVPSAGPQSQAAGIVESGELRRLIEDGKGRFDLVVIDTPPISKCNDALLMERLTDGFILVTRPDYTNKGMLEAILDEMTEIEEDEESPLLGIAINSVNTTMESPVLREKQELFSFSQEDEEKSVEKEKPVPLG